MTWFRSSSASKSHTGKLQTQMLLAWVVFLSVNPRKLHWMDQQTGAQGKSLQYWVNFLHWASSAALEMVLRDWEMFSSPVSSWSRIGNHFSSVSCIPLWFAISNLSHHLCLCLPQCHPFPQNKQNPQPISSTPLFTHIMLRFILSSQRECGNCFFFNLSCRYSLISPHVLY